MNISKLWKETKTEKNGRGSENEESAGTNTTVPFVTSQRVAVCFIPLESGACQWSQEELPLIPGEVHWQDRDTDDCCCEERSESCRMCYSQAALLTLLLTV